MCRVFGMPFIGDGGADSEAMSDHILAQAMGIKMTPSRDVIPDLDLKQVLFYKENLGVKYYLTKLIKTVCTIYKF